MQECNFIHEYLKKYPASKARDLVKLLFQRELGGGHMIENAEMCLEAVKSELDVVAFDDKAPLFEDIGNGMARLNLAAAKALPPELIAGMFMHTANTKKGDHAAFLKALDALKARFPEFSEYIDVYIKQGCPALSHSPAYADAYAPHYRVVYSAYEGLIPLMLKAFELLTSGKRRVVWAIDGPCATGKTFTAELIKGAFALVIDAEIIPADDFFLPFERRTPERMNEIGGNIDYERLKSEVIDRLSDDFITYGVFDCKTQKIAEMRKISARGLLIIEGAYSLHPCLGRYYDLSTVLSAPFETRLERLKRRETPHSYAQFLHKWIPLEDRYFAALSGKNGDS